MTGATPPVDRALLDEAVTLARDAGARTLQWFRHADLDVDHKGDGSPVTAADRDAERFIRDELARRYPDDGVFGEEEPEKVGTSGRRWFVDPIDGTKAFTRGVPLYSTLLAVYDEHGPAIGVIDLPALGETVYAGRGLGCFHDGEVARVSRCDDLGDAYLTTSGFDGWPEPLLLGALSSGAFLRTWGDGYGYALVATGRADVMVDPEVQPYDLAPMPVIISEAGGRFSDFTGADRIDGGNGIATNGRLHAAALAALTGAAPAGDAGAS